jgi:hypothetical protein
MLDAFEARLADLVADELSGVAALQLVTRPRSDFAAAAADPERVAMIVHVLAATADLTMGDDAREKRGPRGQYQLRTTLRLKGEVAVDAVISTTGGTDIVARRQILMQVFDRLLVALQSDAVRSGRAFRTDTDLGFDLDGFRLARIDVREESTGGFGVPASFDGVRATYDFVGRFWPVETPIEGDHIVALPTRIAVLPAAVPERIAAMAGGPDVSIRVGLDLRAFNGATARVLARLRGASPPGSLIGDTTNVPAGWVAFTPGSDGVVNIVYHPPAALTAPARVRVATALDRPSQPSIPIVELVIEVAGS